MYAMHPMFEAINALSGFEWVEFWGCLAIFYWMVGFGLDSLMKGLAYGPVINSILAFGASIFAAYLRYNYFQKQPFFRYEPLTTISLVVGCIALTMLIGAFLRNRLT